MGMDGRGKGEDGVVIFTHARRVDGDVVMEWNVM
jgi:hypothetical protein